MRQLRFFFVQLTKVGQDTSHLETLESRSGGEVYPVVEVLIVCAE